MDVVAGGSGAGNTLLPGDPRLIDHIVCELKSQGIFDQFRKECIADVDTKPAYQNLRQRVEGSVNGFLKNQIWRPDMNKNQLREMLRKNIYESGFFETGVERIVDQVVNPKINAVFLPQVEDVVYKFLGLKKPSRYGSRNGPLTINTTDLLPTDLDPISPDSEVPDKTLNKSNETDKLDDSKNDDDESPPFEPLNDSTVFSQNDESTNDSHLSGISGLTSHDSESRAETPKNYFSIQDVSNQDSQLSKVSSTSRLSIVTTEEKTTVSDDSQRNELKPENGPDMTENEDKNTMEIEMDISDSNDKSETDSTQREKQPESKPEEKSKSRSDSDRRRKSDRKPDRSDKDRKSDRSRDKYSSSSKHKDSKSSKERTKSSSSSKHRSRSKERSSSKSERKDKERSRSSKSESKRSDAKRSSDSKHRDTKSDSKSSRSEGSKDRKSSSSSSRKEPKKSSKRDDHYSSKSSKPDRRSTDRDSNDGFSQSGASGSNKESGTSSKNSKSDTCSFSGSGGDSGGQSDKIEQDMEQMFESISDATDVKIKKPKFASNIFEARKLMKIRKRMEKLERKRLGKIVPDEVVAPEPPPVEPKVEPAEDDILSKPIPVISKASWDEIEARINMNIDYDSYVDENADSCSSHKSEERVEKKSSDDEDCLYFTPEVSPSTERFFKQIDDLKKSTTNIENMIDSKRNRKPSQKYSSNEYDTELEIGECSDPKKKGQKRKVEEETTEGVVDTDNNNKKIHILEDVSNVDLEENDFSGFNNTSPTPKIVKPKKVPDSPDSDSSDIQKALKKANEERDAILQQLIQPIKNRGPAQASQRYSSDDLYKPRPLFPGTRRTRGIANNADKSTEESSTKRR